MVKHSQADRVDLILNADLEFVNLEVRDLAADLIRRATQPARAGLASMEERVRLVGGELTIPPPPAREHSSKCVFHSRRTLDEPANSHGR